jgi:hypothetical protein
MIDFVVERAVEREGDDETTGAARWYQPGTVHLFDRACTTVSAPAWYVAETRFKSKM